MNTTASTSCASSPHVATKMRSKTCLLSRVSHGSSAFLRANGCTKVTATAAIRDKDGNKIDDDDDDDAKEKRALQTILDATDDSLDLSLPRNMKGCDLYDRSKEVDDAVETLVSLNRVDRTNGA